MSVIPNVTHMHYTAYADPVIRPASPASSVGTAYGPDQTSFSDLEEQIPQPSFEQKWEELIGLHHPRKEELVADRDPLLSVPGLNGQLIPIREKKLDPLEEKSSFQHIPSFYFPFFLTLFFSLIKCSMTESWPHYDPQCPTSKNSSFTIKSSSEVPKQRSRSWENPTTSMLSCAA